MEKNTNKLQDPDKSPIVSLSKQVDKAYRKKLISANLAIKLLNALANLFSWINKR